MALVDCQECGRQISPRAVMCPHCGAPPEVALAEAQPTGVPADWLERAARVSLHQPEGTLDLDRVERLKHEGASVEDLGAVVVELKRLPQLKELSLARNEITDVAPLAGLPGLRYLHLEKNRISQLGPLCELKVLKQLWLYGNPLGREEIIMLEQALPRCEVFV